MTAEALPDQQAELADALVRGRSDPVVWAEEVLGVSLNRAQRRWFRLVRPDEDGWRWRLKIVIHVAGNQIGKTLGVAIIILWACFNKIGVSIRDHEKWLETPYRWFHLSPKQSQAMLPLGDIRLLLRGAHPAQDVGGQRGLRIRLPEGLVMERELEDYPGLVFWNGSEVYFRNTDEKAKALQGRRAAGISFDEAAFETWLKAIVNEVLLMRLVAMDGILLLISTPNGITEFYDFVRDVLDDGRAVDPDASGQPEDFTWLLDGARWGLVWSTVADNIGYGLSQEAVDLMESSLDETTKEQQLRGAFLEPQDAFFTPAKLVLDAFKPLPDESGPRPGRRYVFMWDPSVSSDPTVGLALDITDPVWRGVRFIYHRRPPGVHALLMEMRTQHAFYNSAESRRQRVPRSSCITAYDSTAMGGQIIRQSLAGVHPSRPIDFGGPKSKMDILANLRAALVQGRLQLPDGWSVVRRELLNYRLDDTKIRQDTVMALAGAVWVATRTSGGASARPFDVTGRTAQRLGY